MITVTVNVLSSRKLFQPLERLAGIYYYVLRSIYETEHNLWYIYAILYTFHTYFCCNLMSPRRHSTVGRGLPTARQAILTSTLHGTTSGTPNDIIAAGTN